MNSDLSQILGYLGSIPNWQYQLGLAQLGPQEMGIASNYLLGAGQLGVQQKSLEDQLRQFEESLGLQTQQAEWGHQQQTFQNQLGLDELNYSRSLPAQQFQLALANAGRGGGGSQPRYYPQQFVNYGPPPSPWNFDIGLNLPGDETLVV